VTRGGLERVAAGELDRMDEENAMAIAATIIFPVPLDTLAQFIGMSSANAAGRA
jgi:hypothetical protein